MRPVQRYRKVWQWGKKMRFRLRQYTDFGRWKMRMPQEYSLEKQRSWLCSKLWAEWNMEQRFKSMPMCSRVRQNQRHMHWLPCWNKIRSNFGQVHRSLCYKLVIRWRKVCMLKKLLQIRWGLHSMSRRIWVRFGFNEMRFNSNLS